MIYRESLSNINNFKISRRTSTIKASSLLQGIILYYNLPKEHSNNVALLSDVLLCGYIRYES